MRPLVAGLRRDIECFALDALFDSITLADLALWEAIVADIRAACERKDIDALVEHDLRFHRALILRHGDHDIFALWQPVVMRMMMHYTRFTDLMDSWREHRRILTRCAAAIVRVPCAPWRTTSSKTTSGLSLAPSSPHRFPASARGLPRAAPP